MNGTEVEEARRRPAPGSASWSKEAYSALSSIVTSCKNFKVRIKSAAALSVPATRSCYGDTRQFAEVWRALSQALEHSEETEDFLEYRYCANLRSELSHTLLHLLSLCQSDDLSAVAATLSGQSKPALQGFLVHYLCGVSSVFGHDGVDGEDARQQTEPTDRLKVLDQILLRLKVQEGDIAEESRSDLDSVVGFLEDILKSCEMLKAPDRLDVSQTQTNSPQKLL